MSTKVGDVVYQISGDTTQFQQDINKTQQISEEAAGRIGNAFKAAAAAVVAASAAIGAAVKMGIEYNAQMEQYTVAMTTALGNEEDAIKAVEQIKKDAATTPFDVSGLTQANMLLLSTGETAEDARAVIMALGDAVSATGGGNNELQRMAQNLQQVKNVGKATSMDIKQFAMAGINIYGLLSDYTGKTTKEVQEMDITYELLTSALKSAAQEGGRYFESMQKQSQTFNGQLSTIKDNATALAGEVTSGIFEKLARDVLPKLNEAIQSIDGEAISNTIVGIIDTFIELAPAIKVATAAFIAFKVAMNIGDVVNAAKLAIDGLLATLAANPLALAAAGITAAIMAVVEAANMMKERIGAAYDEDLKATDKVVRSHQKTRDAIKEEKDTTLHLISTLQTLSAKEQKTEADKRAILGIVEQLNDALPELNLAYDAERDELSKTNDELARYCELKAEQQILDDKADELTDLYVVQAQLAADLADAQEKLNAAQERYEQLVTNIDPLMLDYDQQLQQARGDVLILNQTIMDLTAAQEENNAAIERAAGDLDGYANKTQTTASASVAMAQTVRESLNAYAQSYQNAADSVAKSLDKEIGLFEDMTVKSKRSIDDLISSLESQIKYMDEYQANINKAMELGIDKGLLKKLSDGSKESAEILAGIVKGGEEKVQELNDKFKQVEEGKETFEGTLKTLQTDFEGTMDEMVRKTMEAVDQMDMSQKMATAALYTMQGYANGISQYEYLVDAAISRVADRVQSKFNSRLQIQSPSKVAEESAMYWDLGLVEGLEKYIPNIETASTNVANTVINSFNPEQIASPAAAAVQERTSQMMAAPVVLELDGREIARTTAWWTGEQLAWEEM